MMLLCFLLVLMVLLYFLFTTAKNYYLSCLFLLEAMVLTSLVMSIHIINNSFTNLWIWLLLLTFGVCEAALGLSILISFVKITGADFINPYPPK
uniref:NADH dehydrogenase subunit 4L n=1 Tax=Megalophaedusa masatokandai masatokandai TaxID=1885764 RepID=A0A224A0V0_9EUPU|nr:NADH dehydrogenase subunit 4L [Megalophaedusa masatokandai masatokandai]